MVGPQAKAEAGGGGGACTGEILIGSGRVTSIQVNSLDGVKKPKLYAPIGPRPYWPCRPLSEDWLKMLRRREWKESRQASIQLRLACRVKANHQNAHLLLAEHARPDL